MPTIRSISVALTGGLLAAAAPPAAGEHVEMTIAISAVPGDIVATLGGAVGTVVFDTDAPPVSSDAQSVTFAAETGWIDAALFDVGPNTTPSIASPSLNRIAGRIDGAELVYSQSGDRNIIVRLFMGDATMTLTVFSPAGAFSPVMSSLPDDAGSYVVQDATDYVVFGNVLTDDGSIFANINRMGSFVSAIGGISYNARLVEAPELPPCNAADLAQPFGQLDFDDVIAFLTGFAQMDLASDLATPNCSFDFDDVLAFIVAYGVGCP